MAGLAACWISFLIWLTVVSAATEEVVKRMGLMGFHNNFNPARNNWRILILTPLVLKKTLSGTSVDICGCFYCYKGDFVNFVNNNLINSVQQQQQRPGFTKELKWSYLRQEERRKKKESISKDEKFNYLLPSSYFKICTIKGTRAASGRKQPRNNFFIMSTMRK